MSDSEIAAALNRIADALNRQADADERHARVIEQGVELDKMRVAQGTALNKSMQDLAKAAG